MGPPKLRSSEARTSDTHVRARSYDGAEVLGFRQKECIHVAAYLDPRVLLGRQN